MKLTPAAGHREQKTTQCGEISSFPGCGRIAPGNVMVRRTASPITSSGQEPANGPGCKWLSTDQAWKRCREVPFPQPGGKKHSVITHLEHGARFRDLQEVRWALEKGVNPNESVEKKKFWPALFVACLSRSPDVVDLLSKFGANPNLAAGSVWALNTFYNERSAEAAKIVESLIDYGADPLLKLAPGYPALSSRSMLAIDFPIVHSKLVRAEKRAAIKHGWTEEEQRDLFRER